MLYDYFLYPHKPSLSISIGLIYLDVQSISRGSACAPSPRISSGKSVAMAKHGNNQRRHRKMTKWHGEMSLKAKMAEETVGGEEKESMKKAARKKMSESENGAGGGIEAAWRHEICSYGSINIEEKLSKRKRHHRRKLRETKAKIEENRKRHAESEENRRRNIRK